MFGKAIQDKVWHVGAMPNNPLGAAITVALVPFSNRSEPLSMSTKNIFYGRKHHIQSSFIAKRTDAWLRGLSTVGRAISETSAFVFFIPVKPLKEESTTNRSHKDWVK